MIQQHKVKDTKLNMSYWKIMFLAIGKHKLTEEQYKELDEMINAKIKEYEV